MSSFQTPHPIAVTLELRVADVRVAAGARADTRVEVRPRDAAQRDDVSAAADTRVEYADGRLLVKEPRRLREWSPFGSGGSIDVEIELPAGSDLSVQTVLGSIRCAGPVGHCQLRSGFGDVSLERCSGDAELATGSGEVHAGEIGGSAVIRNANGDTWLAAVAGDLRVKAANGHIEVERSRGSVNARSANGRIRIGSIRHGSLVARTAAGRIEVGIADGVAAWLDLHTRHGHVYNELEAAAAPAATDEQVEVRASTAYGDITIRRDLEGRGELVAGAVGYE